MRQKMNIANVWLKIYILHGTRYLKYIHHSTEQQPNNNNNNDRLTAFDPGQPG